jgi:MoxR-like ATPase
MSTRSLLNNIRILNKPCKGYEGFVIRAKRGKDYEIQGQTITISEDLFENKKDTEIVLNPAFLNAVDLIKKEAVTYGLQENNGKVTYILSEYMDESSNEIIATAYSPLSGRINSCSKSPITNVVKGARTINGVEGDGTEVWLSILITLSNVNSMEKDWIDDLGGDNFANELYDSLQIILGSEPADVVYYYYKLQQKLWELTENARIPLNFNTTMAKGDDISKQSLESGMYNPTTVECGEFNVFCEGKKRKKITKIVKELIPELTGKYVSVETESEKELVPNNEELLVTEQLEDLITAIVKGHERVFILRGDAGTGKSTVVQNLATALQLPYRFLNCSAGTDEASLLSNMIPNMDSEKEFLTLNEATDIRMGLDFDAAGTVKALTGEEVDDNISEGEAFLKVVNAICSKKKEAGKDFKLVKSQLIEGISKPSVVEILEPTLISNAGVLPALNSLLDETGKTTLVDGSVIELDPNSIIVFTTNMDYAGCKDLNESLKSRATTILDFEELSDEEMVNRVLSRTDTKKLMDENGIKMPDAIWLCRKVHIRL